MSLVLLPQVDASKVGQGSTECGEIQHHHRYRVARVKVWVLVFVIDVLNATLTQRNNSTKKTRNERLYAVYWE